VILVRQEVVSRQALQIIWRRRFLGVIDHLKSSFSELWPV
jgi:hypothetical protein